MTWSEHWPIVDPIAELMGSAPARTLAELVDAALLARDLVVGPTIVFESGELEGAQIECFGRYLTIALGIGDLNGRIAISMPAPGSDPELAGDTGFIEFTSDDVRGDWEPLYTLFAELALALGAAQEAPFVAPLDPTELRDDVQAIVDACISDGMTAEGLDSADAVIVAATAGEPFAFDLDVGFRAEAVVVRVTGAGAHFEVMARGLVAGLSAAGRAAIVRALHEDLEPRIAYHGWTQHQRRAPDDDPERGGKLFLERRAGARVIDTAELTELAALRAAIAEHDVDVIRYFASGAPFWKASYERGHELDELVTSLDELHADRTWQWSAAPTDDDATG